MRRQLADGVAMRWLLLAVALLLIVLCDGLHGFHHETAPALQYRSDSGQRDGKPASDQTAKPRRRIATDLVHEAPPPQPLAGLVPPAAALSAPGRRARATPEWRVTACAAPQPVLYLVRGQDPPAVRALAVRA